MNPPLSLHPLYEKQIRESLPHWDGDFEHLLQLDIFEETGNRALFRFCTSDRTDYTVDLEIPSLRMLFRGNRNPGEFQDCPQEYVPFFNFLESRLQSELKSHPELSADDSFFLELFSAMRRRPDGKSIGYLHDIVWRQTVHFLLTRKFSQAETETCFHRLERAVRSFHPGFGSANYKTYLLGEMPGGRIP